MTRGTTSLGLLLLALSPASGAHAYSDLARFSDPTDMGGGDGHWFTGAPGDGYTCSVCHESKQTIPVTITGLPERYQPGATYEVMLSWPADVMHVSALVEFTDELGHGAGSVLLPGESAMPMTDADTCQPIGLGIPAAERFAAPDFSVARDRQLIGVLDDCGAAQLRFQWSAPVQAGTTVMFSGGVVRSDDKDDPSGDAVVELSRPILPASLAQYELTTQGGCAVSRAHSDGSHGLTALVSVACAMSISRWRRRRT